MPNSPLKLLNEDDSFTSREKLDLSRELHSSFTSSASGLSLEEITCEEVDDILPKTDYTYSKSASYSVRYLNRKRYRSPNMSRRKVRSSRPSFLSDDEDEVDDGFRDEATTSSSFYHQRGGDLEDLTSSDQGSEVSSRGGRRSQSRNFFYTSTPHHGHSISTHDHYYDGMLLRSGHKLEGVKWHMDKDGMVYEYDATGSALLPTPIGHSSDLDMSKLRGSLTTNKTASPQILTTTTIRTTTTTTYTSDKGQSRLRGKKSHMELEDAERKLRLDEAETEKQRKQTNNEHYIKHMYGLDSEEDLSDIDVVAVKRSAKTSTNHHTRAQAGFVSYFTAIITTIITTVTEGSLTSGVKSVGIIAGQATIRSTAWLVRQAGQFFTWLFLRSSVSYAVKSPAQWLLRRLGLFSSWLVRSSATLLLYEVDMKRRRRRGGGCCFWLFPLLLLLPLAVLVAYYWHSVADACHLSHIGHMTGEAGSFIYTGLSHTLSASTGALSSGSSQAWMWLVALVTVNSTRSQNPSSTPKPALSVPATFHATEPDPGVDLDQLYLYIQQKVEQTWQVKGEQLLQKIDQIQLPEGMSKEEVEAIVAAALAGETGSMKDGLHGLSIQLKDLWEKRSSSLEARIAELEAEIQSVAQHQQMLLDRLKQTQASFESVNGEEKAQWVAASTALDAKLADLSASVSDLSSQNAALTALVGNCCRNNTSTETDTIRAYVISILTEMGEDENSLLAGVLGNLGNQYVKKSELDSVIETVKTDIQGKVMEMVALRLEAERKERNKLLAEKEDKVVEELRLSVGQAGSIDEQMVKSIVDEALAQFSADRVGLPDFALESAGGSVLSVRCSETFYRKTALVSVFGLPLWYTSNSPRTVIQPNVHPGECWAFKGQSGYIVVQLSHPIQVTGFTLEHIPRSLAPRGDISSAPYTFSVFGLASESDTQGMNLGNYTYEDNGQPIQHYHVQNGNPGIFQLIELRVLTNHGNPEYTCIYRFRVHGVP